MGKRIDKKMQIGSHCSSKPFFRIGGKLSIYKAFYNAFAVADISDLYIHDFRHLFCTTAAQSGTSILQIKAITGHKTLQQLSGYTHIEGARLKHIVDDVDKALASIVEIERDEIFIAKMIELEQLFYSSIFTNPSA